MDSTTLALRVMGMFGDVYTVTADAASTAGYLILPLSHPDAYFEGWYAWVLSTTDNLPPIGETQRIGAWDSTTGTATLLSPFSASPAGATIVLSVISHPVVTTAMKMTLAESTHVEVETLNINLCVGETRIVPLTTGQRLARVYQETSKNLVWQGIIASVDAINRRLYFTSPNWTVNQFLSDAHTANIYTGKAAGTRDYIVGNGTDYITLQNALPWGVAEGDYVTIRRPSQARYTQLYRMSVVPNRGYYFPDAMPGAGLAIYGLRPPQDVSELPENWALWRTTFNTAGKELGRLPSNVARTVQLVAEMAKAESEAARRIDQKHPVITAFSP